MSELALSSDKATIIIAAYNESKNIQKTLSHLLTEAVDSYQILVVCNGCTDDTENLVRSFKNVHCHSLQQASKALAIQYAESLNPGFPRLYLDADIELSSLDARTLFDAANKHLQAALIIPSSKLIDKHSSTLVKRFYRHWYQTPYVQQSGYGAGAYLINKAGRKRFGQWPELIADDAFVRHHFNFDEIHIVTSVHTYVLAPKTIWSLINIKTRSKLGNMELKAYLRERPSNKLISIADTTSSFNWFDSTIYAFVNVVALYRAKWHFLLGIKKWHRDNSNR